MSVRLNLGETRNAGLDRACPHHPERRRMRRAALLPALVAVCLMTTGCWFFFFVPARRTGESLDAQFGRFVRDVSVRPWHNAVAVAKDSQRWAWGGAWSEPDADAARKAALHNCVSERARHGVDAPCQIYSVDGQITE